ncbi:hypothetical protein BD779DRAFT_1670985 [Infundibulicybe gibba]|nr:hypothetical protein BD779DRAFT_1670985 [Infundibulicybe gibba]
MSTWLSDNPWSYFSRPPNLNLHSHIQALLVFQEAHVDLPPPNPYCRTHSDINVEAQVSLYIPGFEPQPVSADALGIGSDGRTTWALHQGKVTDSLGSSQFIGTATLVEGPGYASLTYANEAAQFTIDQICSLSGDFALCTIAAQGSTNVQTEFVSSIPVQTSSVSPPGVETTRPPAQTSPDTFVMTEYTTSSQAFREYMSSRERTAYWVQHHSPEETAFYSPSAPPSEFDGLSPVSEAESVRSFESTGWFWPTIAVASAPFISPSFENRFAWELATFEVSTPPPWPSRAVPTPRSGGNSYTTLPFTSSP